MQTTQILVSLEKSDSLAMLGQLIVTIFFFLHRL